MNEKTIKVVNNADEVIEVTETAYEFLYKGKGFKPYVEVKATKTTKPTKTTKTNSSSKKVSDEND